MAFTADDNARICSRGFIFDEVFISAWATYVFSTERYENLTKETTSTKITWVPIHLRVLSTQFRVSRIHPYFTLFGPRKTSSSCNNRHNTRSTENFEKIYLVIFLQYMNAVRCTDRESKALMRQPLIELKQAYRS